MVAQDVIGHAPDHHTRTFGRHLLDDATLDGEQILVAELVVVETPAPAEEGLHHLRNRAEKTFALVTSLKDTGAEPALLRRKRENLFVVVSNAEALGEALPDFSAAASELASHSDDERKVHEEKREKKS